jgi:hypothetical protein
VLHDFMYLCSLVAILNTFNYSFGVHVVIVGCSY